MTSSTVENNINDLAQRIWNHHATSHPSRRTLVSISGVPGSGKSTLSHSLVQKLNSLHLKQCHPPQTGSSTAADPSSYPSHSFALDIPMDGYHLSRSQLRALPDPQTAFRRRGAPFTYDATGYCQLVKQLAQAVSGETDIIYAPAFDHATKDPVADSIAIDPKTRIVILEGNYVNLNLAPWRGVTMLFDVKLMVTVDRLVARERLIKRHLSSGVCADEASARSRVETSDELNADEVLAHRVEGVVEVALL